MMRHRAQFSIALLFIAAGSLFGNSIAPAQLPNGTVNQPYSQDLTCYSCGISALTISAGALPPGLTLISNPTTSAGTITGTPTQAGVFPFTIQVAGNDGLPYTQSFTIIVVPGPFSVVQTFLPNGVVGGAYSTTLTTLGGVPPITWSLPTAPSWLTINSSTGQLAGTPPATGAFSVKVSAVDSTGANASATYTLTVSTSPLTITTASLVSAAAGVPYSATIAAAGGSPPYTWNLPIPSINGLSINSATGQISGTPLNGGTFSPIAVTVTDSRAAQFTRGFTLSVLAIQTASLPDGALGEPYSATLGAIGASPSFVWTLTSGSALPSGLALSTSGLISGTPTQSGTFTFSVRLGDQQVSLSRTLSISISGGISIVTSALPNGAVGTPYAAVIQGSSGAGIVTLKVVAGSLPAGLALASSGAISGTPTAPGVATFTVSATDSANAIAQKAFSVTIAPVGTLTITTTTLPDGVAGVPYVGGIQGAGGTGTLTFKVVQGALPAGLTLAGNGVISGTPTTASVANFTVSLTDTANTIVQNAFSITIAPIGTLAITPSGLPVGTVGTAYASLIQGSGGTGVLIFKITQGSLPPGLTFASNGAISGTPTAPGIATFVVGLTDSANTTVQKAFSILITPIGTLTITTSGLPDGVVGTVYGSLIQGSGGTGTFTFQVVQGSLPSGLTLANNGSISGIPTAIGVSTFTVSLTDGANTIVQKALSITIAPPQVLTITTSILPNGAIGSGYAGAIQGSGGAGAYAFKVIQGSLPAGLTLASSGAISGTPTASGASTFTVSLTDGANTTVQKAFSITIAPPGVLTITTSILPDGAIGSGYAGAIQGSGGTGVLTFKVIQGSLPAGLTLATNGVISGTPTASGIAAFTVSLTDGANTTVQKALSITIAPPGALTITTSSLPSGAVAIAYLSAIQGSGGTGAYAFKVIQGSLPAGLLLASNGAISGTPTAAGDTTFTVSLTDGANTTVQKVLSLTIAPPGALVITTSALPVGGLGAAYFGSIQGTGGIGFLTFKLVQGSLPAGLTLASSGAISGTPTAIGTATFTVSLTDSANTVIQRVFSLTIAPPPTLTITTESFPEAQVGSVYSATLAATLPSTWSIVGGSLPAGLGLNSSSGTIAGTPAGAGAATFTVQAQSGLSSMQKQFTITVVLPPDVSFSGLPSSTSPAQQPSVSLTLSRRYKVPVTGTLTLTFLGPGGVDNPEVRFSNGTRTVNFTFPADSTNVSFGGPSTVSILTGTVAGTITLTATATDLTGAPIPTPVPAGIAVTPTAPVITSVKVTTSPTGFSVTIVGYSPTRDMVSGQFHLTPTPGNTINPADVTVQLAAAFSAWYNSEASVPLGSQFSLTVNFTGQGNTPIPIGSVAVQLLNSLAPSTQVTASP